ncbi:MAG: hypothetical protein R2811_12730 [Flavobacteriales bacterium]
MCSKEASEPMAETHGAGSISTEAILSKIQRFRSEQRKEVREKSLVLYTVEEAKLVVEGTFNWGNVDPEAKYGEMKEDAYSVTIMVTDGKVSEDDLLAAYAELEAAMNADALGADEKFHLMDVEAKEENGDLVLTTYRISSKDVPGPVGSGLNTSFIGEHRAESFNAGCNINRADLAIQTRLNNAIGLLPNIYTVVDVQRWQVLGGVEQYPGFSMPFVNTSIPNRQIASLTLPNPNDPDGPSPIWLPTMYNDYLVYLTPESTPAPQNYTFNDCLPPAAMAYLTQSAYDLMYTIKNTYVQNSQLVPISTRVTSFQSRRDYIGNPFLAYHRLGHNITYTYGRVILSGGTAG